MRHPLRRTFSAAATPGRPQHVHHGHVWNMMHRAPERRAASCLQAGRRNAQNLAWCEAYKTTLLKGPPHAPRARGERRSPEACPGLCAAQVRLCAR